MQQPAQQNWNLDSLYAGGSQSNELKNFITELKAVITVLTECLNVFEDTGDKLKNEEILEFMDQFQFVQSGWEELDDLAICIYAQNVTDSDALVLMDESAVIKSQLNTLQIDFDKALADFPENRWHEFINLEQIQPYSFYMDERRKMVQDRLPVEMEQLINVLSVNGIKGWEQHHQQILENLKIPIQSEEGEKGVSVDAALDEAMHAEDRSRREQAADSLAATFETHAEDFASVFNRIAGFRLDVYEQRGWENVLKESFEQNRITEESLKALIASIDDNKALYQAYVQRKLELLQITEPRWFDLESPRFTLKEKVSYDRAQAIIVEQFHRFSGKLGDFAKSAFEKEWIEAENRPDKAGGAFCASMPLKKESRVFMTFRENYQDVVTLAHEMGHAYHNYILHEEPALAQMKGASVAESASTFMENLVLDAAIEQTADANEKLALLEVKITEGLKYVVSVPNMFRFEQAFYEKRKDGLLTAEEIYELNAKAENDFFGGRVTDLASYKWMFISHFYSSTIPFYNIPYTIGYLFSNGIYNLSKKSAGGFQEQYDELLRNSGRMTIEGLVQTYLDADATKKEFWADAQQSLKEAIEEYLVLTEGYVG